MVSVFATRVEHQEVRHLDMDPGRRWKLIQCLPKMCVCVCWPPVWSLVAAAPVHWLCASSHQPWPKSCSSPPPGRPAPDRLTALHTEGTHTPLCLKIPIRRDLMHAFICWLPLAVCSLCCSTPLAGCPHRSLWASVCLLPEGLSPPLCSNRFL